MEHKPKPVVFLWGTQIFDLYLVYPKVISTTSEVPSDKKNQTRVNTTINSSFRLVLRIYIEFL